MVRFIRHRFGIAFAAAALLAPTGANSEGESPFGGDPATLLGARWGQTPKGATRVVLQVDRTVEFLTVELPHENGFEVHLLNTNADPLPEPLAIGNGRIANVTFRPGPSGTVARIAGGPQRLRAMTFKLDGPPRIVVDVTVDDDAPLPLAAPPVTVARPVVKKKAPKTEVAKSAPAPRVDDAMDALLAAHDTVATADVVLPDADADLIPPPATPESALVAVNPDGEFDELLSWITGVKLDAAALALSESEEDRARYLRSLAFLLAQRGLVDEAEQMLGSALQSEGYDQGSAFADSAYWAELKLQTGDHEGASELAQTLSAAQRTPPQRLRLARILSECDFHDLARMHLEEAVPRLTGRPRIEGQLLLAHVYWDRQEIDKAQSWVKKLTDSKYTPREILGEALILHADCVWAMGKPAEAEGFYRRALALSLGDEEASWVTLQLGNLAHRAGRTTDAIDHYRRARDEFPETFYGAQADWFLRVAEQTERLQNKEVVRNRG
ncbi:MAG: tetratricopeptide repeat protein [Gemmatimonadetes bacterium]|nr:tetratricopeptide repeat protein [Gemmatimonadota bacterium]